MAKMPCELEAHMAEAWGDAPFLIPRVEVRSDSEKSFPFQIWSTPSRIGDEVKVKKEFDHHSPSVSHTRSPFSSRIKSFLQNGQLTLRPSAYFSPHPPSSPLCLVPQISLEPPYEDISNFNECLKTNLDGLFERKCDSEICLVIGNMVENIVDKVVDIASKHAIKRAKLGQPGSIVYDEIALRKPHIDKSAATVIPVTSVEVGSISRASSPLRWRFLNTDTRNIAVQAKIYNLEQDKRYKKEHPPAEWSGGVRALRDSHVRLVLRQLKHIERLNRALDRRQ